ncbi:MAG: hypothetical protein AN484_27600, partial [Aphanizomenon flos-aquae WA102]
RPSGRDGCIAKGPGPVLEHGGGQAEDRCEGELQQQGQRGAQRPLRGPGGGPRGFRARGHHKETAVESGAGSVRPARSAVRLHHKVQAADEQLVHREPEGAVGRRPVARREEEVHGDHG